MKILKIQKHGRLWNWNGQATIFFKMQISFCFLWFIILNGENDFSKKQKVKKSYDYNWSFQPSSQISDPLQNLQLLQIMTGQKQVFIGFPLNFIGLNIIEKKIDFWKNALSLYILDNWACFWPRKWENWSEKNMLLYFDCYDSQRSVSWLLNYLNRCPNVPKLHGTWLLSFIFSSKPPFYPWFFPTNPLIIGALDIFLILHVSWDTYDRKTRLW